MESQIKALVTLQDLDLSLVAIAHKKGTLPKQLVQLEEELANLESQKESHKEAVVEHEATISNHQEEKKKASCVHQDQVQTNQA